MSKWYSFEVKSFEFDLTLRTLMNIGFFHVENVNQFKDTIKSDKLVWRKSRVTQSVTSSLYATSSPKNGMTLIWIISWVVEIRPLNDMHFFSFTTTLILFSSFFLVSGIHVISLGSFEGFTMSCAVDVEVRVYGSMNIWFCLSPTGTWVPCEPRKKKLSMKSWLVYRDPQKMAYEIIPI